MNYFIKILFVSFFLFFISCGNKNKKSVSTCKAQFGVFPLEITETGELTAVNAINISAPPLSWQYGMLKILKIVDEGTEVSKNDTVLIFDPSEVQKNIVNAQSEIEIANAELDKLKAEHEQRINDLESDLKIAKISYEISKIKLELASYESEVNKKEIQLSLDKAKISLDKAEDEIVNQKRIQTEEISQANLRINQLKNNLEDAQRTLGSLTVTSPSDGVAMIKKNRNSGNKYQVGDQTWSGNAIVELPDLREFKVLTNINEVDVSKIKLNQEVNVKLDAFSDSTYYGKVISIALLANFKDDRTQKIKVFPVEVLLNNTSKSLMPGMTVSTKIIIDKKKDVVFIPLEALFKKENEQFVYIKKATGFKKQIIKTDLANNDYIIVKEGVENGDVLALSDPFEVEKPENNNDEKTKKQ